MVGPGGALESVLLILLLVLEAEAASSGQLWCYECNTDLATGHKGECNDPYSPGVSHELVACDPNEPHHCLKSVILYLNVLVTVRACVPTNKIDHYCSHEANFPDSSIDCYFCNGYACNSAGSFRKHMFSRNFTMMAIALIVLSWSTI